MVIIGGREGSKRFQSVHVSAVNGKLGDLGCLGWRCTKETPRILMLFDLKRLSAKHEGESNQITSMSKVSIVHKTLQ